MGGREGNSGSRCGTKVGIKEVINKIVGEEGKRSG